VSQTAGTSAADHEAGNVKDDPDERLPEVCCGVEQTAESGEDTAEARDCNADEERQDCRLEPVALDLAREPGGKQEFCSGPDQSPDPTSSNEVDPAQETATVVDEPKEEIQDRLDKSTNTDYAMQISEMYQIPGTRTDVVEVGTVFIPKIPKITTADLRVVHPSNVRRYFWIFKGVVQ
jgi:hypothetical protein